jgi:integrase
MPPTQRGQAYRLSNGKWGLRYYDAEGKRRRKTPFDSKSKALKHYRDVIEPRLRGDKPHHNMTLNEFVPIYLDRHAAVASGRTIETLRDRLKHATRAFGDVHLLELESMSGEIADWKRGLSDRMRYSIVQALRQTLQAAIRWDYMTRNPAVLAGRNPQPKPRPIRAYTQDELDAIAAELAPEYQAIPALGAATGLRPSEWAAVERGDFNRRTGVLLVHRSVTGGKSKEVPLSVVDWLKRGETGREVPLSPRALAALDAVPVQLGVRRLFSASRGGPINLDNWREDHWTPAVEAAGVLKPARPYDLRSTFASNAIAAGIGVFELARIMGTSVRMIERHYGKLLEGASTGMSQRLAAFEAAQDEARRRAARGV